ncbi:MAG: OmpH family outer membrane protein [Candidatus Melainabacteria bacterium]|nr:OmpH family outer membrane protein [Candidatus Melainabacteria bacterium]
MYTLQKSLVLVTSALSISLCANAALTVSAANAADAPAAPAATPAVKTGGGIGVVDPDKVVKAYPKAEQLAKDLKKEEDRVHKMIEDGNRQLEEAKTAHKPPAELEGLQRRLQETIDTEVKKVQGRAQSLETQLESDVQNAIKAEAAARKLDIVLLKPVVFMGGIDLTDSVMKRLAAAAPQAAKPATK